MMPTQAMKKTLVVLGIITGIVVFFFRSYLFGGKLLFPTNLLVAFYSPWNTQHYTGWNNIPFKGLGSDNLFIFYPMKTLLRQAITQHGLPLWTPYNFTGGPLFGDGESAPMYPLTYLYLFPSLPDAFSLMVILVPALTMIFTYGCLRHFKLARLSALFGAVTFAFSGFMSVWMEENPAVSQSAIWLPLLLWLEDLLITNPKCRWFVAFAIATAIMMSSGFLQICLYELIFIGAYALWKNWRRLWLILLSGTTGLLLIAPYLAVTWEAYKLSPREIVSVPEIRSIFLVQWSHIISLFNPDWLGNPGTYNFVGVGSYYDKALFIGVIPLIFALIGLFTKKSAWEKFFWWAAAVTLFLGFSSPFTQWLFSLPIPIVSSMLPSRIFYLTSFALSVIAAGIFDRMRNTDLTKSLRPITGVYLTMIILLETFLIAYYTEIGLPTTRAGSIAHTIRSMVVSPMDITETYPVVVIRNIALSILITAFTMVLLYISQRFKKIRSFIPIILLSISVASAWYFTNKSLYFGERQFVYPENPVISKLQQISGIDRIGFVNDTSRIPSGANVIYGLYSPEGLNPVFPLRYGQLIRSAVNGGLITNDIPRISVQFDLEPASRDTTTAARIQKLMSLVDIKYIVQHKKTVWYARVFPTHTPIWEGEVFRIWENPDVLPRAFVVQTAIVQTDPQKILDAIYASNLQTAAIVEEPVSVSKNAKSSDAEITSYRMNDVTIKTHSGGLLVITDNWAPGWKATVDGKEVPVYRTDFTFRGIPVPAGDHTVYMYYWPQSLIIGLWAMGGGIVLLLALILTWYHAVSIASKSAF